MRGKVCGNRGKVRLWRITPAYAGKSFHECHRVIKSGDHPRLCGEKFSGIWENIKGVGSPPPMRGKVKNYSFTESASGITPAYAGKSQILWISDRSQEDHPRLCGEKLIPLC